MNIENLNLDEILQEIENAKSKEEIERIRNKYLSKKGIFLSIFASFASLSKEEKKKNKIDGYLRFYKHMELCHRAYKSSPLRRGHDLVKEQEAQLIKSISNTDDIDVYQAIYHYLVWNEYFSAEKNS